MKQAYTPALEASPRTTVRKLRELPLPGRTLVKMGQRVTAGTSVLAAELPGDLAIVRVAERMGFEPIDVLSGIKVKTGDRVSRGDLLCRVKTFFGMFSTELHSPTSGIVEFFTEANTHLGIRQQPKPFEVDAYVEGEVVEVEEGKSVTIEVEGAFVQGIFGVGGERRGEILILAVEPSKVVTAEDLKNSGESLAGKVVVGGAKYTSQAFAEAARQEVAAVVCGSIDAETLYEFVGHQIGVAITGDEQVPFTLIITEGFGELAISNRVLELAKDCEGMSASINGATQVRAGATRPEIIVSLGKEEGVLNSRGDTAKHLEVGADIRIIRVPYFGALGAVMELPSEPQRIPSGASVRVLRARLKDGKEVVVPRANVELV